MTSTWHRISWVSRTPDRQRAAVSASAVGWGPWRRMASLASLASFGNYAVHASDLAYKRPSVWR